MQIARQLSEARRRGIFETATLAIVTADHGHTIVVANPAAARLFGPADGALHGTTPGTAGRDPAAGTAATRGAWARGAAGAEEPGSG